jgi:hypothetical protein
MGQVRGDRAAGHRVGCPRRVRSGESDTDRLVQHLCSEGSSNGVCTADASLNRYFCAISSYVGGTDVSDFQLWVYDLNTYALVNVVDFGSSANAGGSISGWFEKLVRWGNAGLALASFTDPAGRKGNGGLFLIDGAAVNPNAAPDVTGGTSSAVVASMTSLSVQSAQAGSPDVSLTITGENFSPDSTACWNCNFLQFNFLPTTYVSETQLNVTIPASVRQAFFPSTQFAGSEPVLLDVSAGGKYLYVGFRR